MANTTQGLALALFGAYAGGYTAQLDADIATSGLGPVAASLVDLQGPALGLNLKDDAAWIDLTLGHLGIDSTNAAYAAAKGWFEGALPALGRGGAAAAAVNYLLGDSVGAAYASVATAFAADVAAGAAYSATAAGAAEFSVSDLRVEAGNPATGTAFNLTAALATLLTGQDAVNDFVDAWGLEQDPVIKAVDSEEDDVTAAVEDAEAALQTAVGAAALNTTTDYDEVEAELGDKDALEDALLAEVKKEIADEEKALDDAAAAAKKALTDINASLASAVSNLTAAETAQTAAVAATDKADVALTAAEDNFEVDNPTLGMVTTTGANGLTATTTIVLAEGGNTMATYTKATGAWVVEAAYKSVDLAALQAAAVALDAAEKAEDQADALVQARLDTIAKLDGDQVDGDTYVVTAVSGGVTYYAEATTSDADVLMTDWSTDIADALQLTAAEAAAIDTASTLATTTTYTVGSATGLTAASEAEDYNDALADIVAFDKAKAAFDKAEAAVTAARADGAELIALQKAVTDATKVLTDEGYAVDALADGDFVTGTAKADVYTLGTLAANGEAATINDFGLVGEDLLYIGSDWTFNSGKIATAGDDAVLEVFAAQSGANVVLSFETAKFGSNADAGAEVFTVTLTGVSLTDLSISNGYVQLA